VTVQAEWIGKGAAPFESMEATAKSPDGKTMSVRMQPSVWQNPDGRRVTGFRGETVAGATGIYEVAARAAWTGGEADSTMRFAVASSPEERRGEAPDAAFLQAIAKQSNGGYFARGEGDKWLDSLPKPGRRTEREIVTDVWNHPVIVILLFGFLCAEWWFRRRKGLA